jgi:hypothetical protein
MLTFFGFCGSLLTALSFILAKYLSVYYLLLGVLGFIINCLAIRWMEGSPITVKNRASGMAFVWIFQWTGLPPY